MARYTMEDVSVEGAFTVSTMRTLSMDIGVNRHGYCTYGGLISGEAAMRYSRMEAAGAQIKISLRGDAEFIGHPVHVEIRQENELYWLFVKLATGSHKMDLVPRQRFFQDVGYTYAQMLDEAYRDSGIGTLTAICGNEPIQRPILQYRETDWDFTLRMAGLLGTVVVPDTISAEPFVSLGIPKRNAHTEAKQDRYFVRRHTSEYRKKDGLYPNISYQNFVCYRIKSKNRYKLGDSVLLDGMRFVVMEKTFQYEEGVIEEVYALGLEQDFCVPKHRNKHIAGLELEGLVLERQAQEMKILLDIDAQRTSCEKTWFSYIPVTNNGMYSMPLLQEKVMLQWQSESDYDAMIVRPNRKNGYAMPHHTERHFLTEHDNHMMVLPDQISYVNPIGDIKLLQDFGHKMYSNQYLDITAGGNITIRSGSVARFSTPERLTACKADSGSSVDMQGSEIHIKADSDVKIKSNVKSYDKAEIMLPTKSFQVRQATAAKISAAAAQRVKAN